MIVDQVLSSVSNLALVLLVAGVSTGEDFGAFSVALVVQNLAFGAARVMFGETILLRLRHAGSYDKTVVGPALLLVLCYAGIIGAVMVTIGLLLPSPLSTFFLMMALATPFVLVHDFQRYIAFARGRPAWASVLDGTWLVAQCVFTVMVIQIRPSEEAAFLVLAWAGGAAVSGGLGLCVSRLTPVVTGIRDLLRTESRRASAFLSDFAMSTGLAQAAFLLLSGILTLSEFGLLRLAITVTDPVVNLLGSTHVLALAFFGSHRAPNRAVLRVLVAVSCVYGVLTAFYVAGLALVPPAAGEQLFGVLWLQARSLILIAGVAVTIRMLALPAVSFLKAFGTGGTLVTVRTVTGLVMAAALLLGGLLGGPTGSLLGLVLATTVALALWAVALRHCLHGYAIASAEDRYTGHIDGE